jgi:hypothetical protein
MELSYTDLAIGNVLLQIPNVPFGISQSAVFRDLHMIDYPFTVSTQYAGRRGRLRHPLR